MKRILSALVIAIGVLCVLGVGFLALAGWPMIADAARSRETGDKFVQAMRPGWPEAEFARYAAPRLLHLNPKWKEHLVTVRKNLGDIQSAQPARSGQVVRDETVPGQAIYEVLVDIQCERGKAVVRMAVAPFEGGPRLTQFFVESKSD